MMRDYYEVQWFSTPRHIAAFVEAEADRRRYWRGEATEMHIPEPDRGDRTRKVAAVIGPDGRCRGVGVV